MFFLLISLSFSCNNSSITNKFTKKPLDSLESQEQHKIKDINSDFQNERRIEKEELPEEIVIEDLYIDSWNKAENIHTINTKKAYMINNTYDFRNGGSSVFIYDIKNSGNISIIDCSFISLIVTAIQYKTGSIGLKNDYLLIDNCTFDSCKYNVITILSLIDSLETITISNCSFKNASNIYDGGFIFINQIDSIKINILNNEFINCEYDKTDRYLIGLHATNKIIEPVTFENNIFINSCAALKIIHDQQNGQIIINECQFENTRSLDLNNLAEVSFNKCYFKNFNGIEIKESILDAKIENCIFIDCNLIGNYIINIYNKQCIFNNNTIDFTLNENESTPGGIYVTKHGNIIITNNHFNNFNIGTNSQSALYLRDTGKIFNSADVVIVNYNIFEKVISQYQGFYIHKSYLFEFNHNIVKECYTSNYNRYIGVILIYNESLFNKQFIIINLTITNCYAYKDDGGSGLWIYTGDGNKLTFQNCTFEYNNGIKGGAYSTKGGSIGMNKLYAINCSFIGNSAQEIGGALYILSYYPANIINCTFSNNHAMNGGGAIYINPSDDISDCTIIGCKFENNTDSVFSAHAIFYALYTNGTPFLTIKECIFIDNSPAETDNDQGSAIYSESPILIIESVQIKFCKPSRSTTGIKTSKCNEITIEKCEMLNFSRSSFNLSSNHMTINDIYINSLETTSSAIVIMHNNENSISINNLQIISYIENAIEFTFLGSPSSDIIISNSSFYANLIMFNPINTISLNNLQIQNCKSTLNTGNPSIIYIQNINSFNIFNSLISSCLCHNIFLCNSFSFLHFNNIQFNSNNMNNDKKSYLFTFIQSSAISNIMYENIISDTPIIITPESQSQAIYDNITFKDCNSPCLIQSLNSELDISNSNFIYDKIIGDKIFDKQSGNLHLYNSKFTKYKGCFEIKKTFPEANIEKCIFTDCYDSESSFVFVISNQLCSFIENTIQFTSNEIDKSIGGLYINSDGYFEVKNNQFINIRKITKSAITIEEPENIDTQSDTSVIFNYNTIVNAGSVSFGVLTINKQKFFEFDHNIIKDCQIHAGYAININLRDGNALDNYLAINNLTLNNCRANAVTGGGLGLLLEFGDNKPGTLKLKDCSFINNAIENNETGDAKGSGCGGAIETGNLTTANFEFICEKCTFNKNRAPNCGGALSIQSSLPATIKNCTFRENKAEHGGGSIYIYPNLNGKLPNCTISECFFIYNVDYSGSGNSIFFKYYDGCSTNLMINECNFVNNYRDKFDIVVNAPILSIESIKLLLYPYANGIKVLPQTEILIINKLNVTNCNLPILISSKFAKLNDLTFIKCFDGIKIEYNGPISINKLNITQDNYIYNAIDFVSHISNEPIQINISNFIFRKDSFSKLVKISDNSINAFQRCNFTSIDLEKSISWIYFPIAMQTISIIDCYFNSIKTEKVIDYSPDSQLAYDESLLIEKCTFINITLICIYVSGSLKSFTVCDCSFEKCNFDNGEKNAIIFCEISGSEINIMNNDFLDLGGNNDFDAIQLNNNASTNNFATIENNHFNNIFNGIKINQNKGHITINDCQFEKVASFTISVFNTDGISIDKCNFSNAQCGIDINNIDTNIGSEFSLTDCIFESMCSMNDGSSLHILTSYSISISGCLFIDNIANNGGAIYIEKISSGKLDLENCTFDNNTAKFYSAIYSKSTTNSIVDISNCSFINSPDKKTIIYSNNTNLIIHDMQFIFEGTNNKIRPISSDTLSKTEIYNINFIKCSINEEGTAIKTEKDIEQIDIHDCKFEDCADTGSSILCLGPAALFNRNEFICTEKSTCSGINIQNANHVEVIDCSFIKMSSKKTGYCISPLNIISNNCDNEKFVFIGLTFTNCYGRNPVCFNILAFKPFVFENITINNHIMDQYETYLGVIDLCDYMDDESFIIRNCQWINNTLFTQYGNGAGLCIKNKPKLKYEFDNCLFENNQHSKNGGGFQEGGSVDNVNKILSFRECNFIGNKAGGKGGGLSIETVLPFTVDHCTFLNNQAEMGGAIYINPTYGSIQNEYGSITNCIFNNNEASLEHGTVICIENPKATEIIFDGSNKITNNGERGSTIYSQCGDLNLIDVIFDFNSDQNVERNFGSIHLIEGSCTTITNCKFIGTGFTTNPKSGHAIKADRMAKKIICDDCIFTDCGNSDSQYVIDSFSAELEFTLSVINFTDPQISCGGIKVNKYSKLTLTNSTFTNCYANYSYGAGICYNKYKLGDAIDCDVIITLCTFDNLMSSNGTVATLILEKSITMSNCTIKNIPNGNYSLVIDYQSYQQDQTILDKIVFTDNQCGSGILISNVNRCIFQNCKFIRNTNMKESDNGYGSEIQTNLVQMEYVGCLFEDNIGQKNENDYSLCINASQKPVILDSCFFSSSNSGPSENGGAIFISSETTQEVTITNSNFKGMKLTTNDSNLGNAIHIDNTTSKVRINGCEFNDCGNKGTVISSNGYNVVIENTNIVFTALSSCQGIVVQYESHFEMINSTISNCISSKEGGAFSYLSNLRNFSDENVLIDNCHFKSNKATQNGGAVGIHSSGIIRIINVTFEKNTANYKQQTSLELLVDEDQTQEGKGGALFINPTNKENLIARVESSILIENCVFRNNEALDGSSIYFSGYDQGNKINIKNNEFYSKKGNSNVILTEICTLSYDELLDQNIFKAEDENGVVREDKNILSSDCKFTPRPTHYFTSSNEFTGSSTFSSSVQFTESNTLLVTVNDQTSTPQLPLKNVRYSKSFSLSYTTRKSVSYSLSYVSSNTLELIYDEIKGTYTMAVSQMNYYAYFPYIIYFMSPVYIEREITIEMVRKSRISPEQLIGVVCGSTSVFFLILGIIILAWKKRNEVKAQFDEFDDISSSEIEVYSKQDDANADNNNLDENENEHTNPLFTKDYSETLF